MALLVDLRIVVSRNAFPENVLEHMNMGVDFRERPFLLLISAQVNKFLKDALASNLVLKQQKNECW